MTGMGTGASSASAVAVAVVIGIGTKLAGGSATKAGPEGESTTSSGSIDIGDRGPNFGFFACRSLSEGLLLGCWRALRYCCKYEKGVVATHFFLGWSFR